MASKLDGNDLATILHNALPKHVDSKKKPVPIPDQIKNYASGIVAALKSATVSNLPLTINGVTAPGQPLSLGAGIGGVMVISPTPMINLTKLKQPAPMYVAENTAIIGYIATGLVTFSPGSITGQCTNTAVSPGPLENGAGKNGKIIGLTGVGAVAAVAAALGKIGPEAQKYYSALINYILATATVTYAQGSVEGVCPTAGGPLGLGAAVGGTVA